MCGAQIRRRNVGDAVQRVGRVRRGAGQINALSAVAVQVIDALQLVAVAVGFQFETIEGIELAAGRVLLAVGGVGRRLVLTIGFRL